MIVTVEEAATKRCQEGYAASKGVTMRPADPPITTYAPQAIPSINAMGAGYSTMSAVPEQGPTAPFYCIGPACMAWKWAMQFDANGDNEWGQWRTKDGQQLGYCGKARR
jgi:hypothetical protein